jgi:aldose 1-epimerase
MLFLFYQGGFMHNIEKNDHYDIIYIEEKNIKVKLMNYGASLMQIQTPNKTGIYEDLLLEYEDVEDYINNNIYLNACIGPVAGRIKNGLIKIDNLEYNFEKNDHKLNTLHSGDQAISFKLFDYKVRDLKDRTEVSFTNELVLLNQFCIEIEILYTVKNHSLSIDFYAKPSKDFYFNMTNHAYINLSGDIKADIKNHWVKIHTDKRYKLDSYQLPTNEILTDPLYDFRSGKKLDQVLKTLNNHPFKGIDDIYLFEDDEPYAEVYEPNSHRLLQITSTGNHLVFYTHNNVNDSPIKHIGKHEAHHALCFEFQNEPFGFGHQVTKKNETYHHNINYIFKIKDD